MIPPPADRSSDQCLGVRVPFKVQAAITVCPIDFRPSLGPSLFMFHQNPPTPVERVVVEILHDSLSKGFLRWLRKHVDDRLHSAVLCVAGKSNSNIILQILTICHSSAHALLVDDNGEQRRPFTAIRKFHIVKYSLDIEPDPGAEWMTADHSTRKAAAIGQNQIHGTGGIGPSSPRSIALH
jgi:hypothetical protein